MNRITHLLFHLGYRLVTQHDDGRQTWISPKRAFVTVSPAGIKRGRS